MPLCPKCNAELPEGLNYCTKCGASLKPGGLALKKGVPTKGLVLGGCGCFALTAGLVGILIIVAILMAGIKRPGPGGTPQPPPVERPGVTPQRPVVTPDRPVRQQRPVTGRGEQYPVLKEGELILLFAKDLTSDGLPVGPTKEFSRNDPQIIQIIRWGPNTVPAGATVEWSWYYNNSNVVWTNYCKAEQGYMGVFDKVGPPPGGYPVGSYTVVVAVNGTQVVDHSFVVR